MSHPHLSKIGIKNSFLEEIANGLFAKNPGDLYIEFS
jgi:cytoskeletal protein RodZ